MSSMNHYTEDDWNKFSLPCPVCSYHVVIPEHIEVGDTLSCTTPGCDLILVLKIIFGAYELALTNIALTTEEKLKQNLSTEVDKNGLMCPRCKVQLPILVVSPRYGKVDVICSCKAKLVITANGIVSETNWYTTSIKPNLPAIKPKEPNMESRVIE